MNFVLFIIFFDFIIGAIGHITAIFRWPLHDKLIILMENYVFNYFKNRVIIGGSQRAIRFVYFMVNVLLTVMDQNAA